MTVTSRTLRPFAGLVVPWLVLISAIFIFGGVIGIFGTTRTTLQVIVWETLRHYGRAAQAMDRLSPSPDPRLDFWRTDLYRSAGMSALLSGDFNASIGWFSRIAESRNPLSEAPRIDYFALLYRGIASWKAGRPVDALRDWEAAILAMPGRHDAWLLRGHSRLLAANEAGAAEDYAQALRIAGTLGIVHVDVGDAWRYTGQTDRALEYYRRGLAVDPADAFSRLRMGEMILETGNDTAGALETARVIRRMMPTLRVAEQLEKAALNWSPGGRLPHIPAARFEPGSSRSWKISPTKIYFEFFREDWHGWR